MEQRTRVEKDLRMFKDNLPRLSKELSTREAAVATLAQQYYADAQYYRGKEDAFTAFGCINYAHGLLDALLKIHAEDEE